MKKLLIFCVTLVMMSSCIEHARIYLKLTDEDAAAIPYHLDQTVDFLDQNGDTLTYKVTCDETYPYDHDLYHYSSKTKIYDEYYCYARTVILECEKTGKRLGFTIRPEKEIAFYLDYDFDLYGSLLTNGPCTIEGIDYEHVHHQTLYDPSTGELIYDWYYNEEYGLIYIKYYDQLLKIIQ